MRSIQNQKYPISGIESCDIPVQVPVLSLAPRKRKTESPPWNCYHTKGCNSDMIFDCSWCSGGSIYSTSYCVSIVPKSIARENRSSGFGNTIDTWKNERNSSTNIAVEGNVLLLSKHHCRNDKDLLGNADCVIYYINISFVVIFSNWRELL